MTYFGGGGGSGSCSMKTGKYTGDGLDNRNIDIGVNLSAKTYVWVVIKWSGVSKAVHRSTSEGADFALVFDAAGGSANTIQAFTATGFQVGTDATVNTNGNNYRYMAFWVD